MVVVQVKKPYIKTIIFFLGGKLKKGRAIGTALGVLSALIRPLLSKIFLKMRRKRNYVMRKLNVPKRVTLPNSRTLARYNQVPRSELPPSIVMRRT